MLLQPGIEAHSLLSVPHANVKHISAAASDVRNFFFRRYDTTSAIDFDLADDFAFHGFAVR